ncbi:MAG: hypothetical protein J6W28_00375 [Clostridia bacterium]|nr:hypothetical protein [Clostridia bacterium]
MKKTLFTILLIFTIARSLACPMFAEEVAETPVDDVENTDVSVDTPPAAENAPEGEEKAATVLLTDWLADHFGDVAAAVGAVGMAVLVWMFKKGLLPAVLTSLVKVKENAEKSSGEFKEETKAVVALVDAAEKRLKDGVAKLDDLIKKYEAQQEATAEAYELQTDLVNYIMLNLRIPNELKAEISERSAAVKNAIEAAKPKGE